MNKKVIAGVFSVLLLAAGCSNSEEAVKEDSQQEQQETQSQASKEVKQNKELTKQVKEEAGVVDGQFYEQDGVAIGKIELDKKVSDADAKKLVEKYAEELKKEYKGMKINVQAVRDGKNVANVTVEEQESQTQASKDVKQNKELTSQVKKEAGVVDGQFYEQDGVAIGKIELDKKVSDADAKKLAEKYTEELKKEYKGTKINVQVIRDGKNVANVKVEQEQQKQGGNTVNNMTNTAVVWGFTTIEGKYDTAKVDKIVFFVGESTTERAATLNAKEGTFSRDLSVGDPVQNVSYKAYKGTKLVEEGTYKVNS